MFLNPLRKFPVALFALAVVGAAAQAAAQTADNVLLVINEKAPASTQIGDYYLKKRGLPQDHVVRIQTVVTDTVQREEYDRAIEAPIAAWLSRHSLQDKILYIVLTKGVPLRVNGTAGLDGTVASVDSELTLLYGKLVGRQYPIVGRIANPLYLDQKPVGDAKPFTRFASELYLVTRLDGFSVADVLKLIDRGSAPSQDGRIVLDQKGSTFDDAGGDRWLDEAATRLRASGAGDRVLLEMTTAAASTPDPVLGYYSWGSNDRTNQLRRFGLTFSPGAIGGMFVSTDGRTFQEPPADWKPSNPNGGPQFAGSFQSLAGDLIRDGITGVSAHVAEPYLDATIRPQILFPAYLAGFNLAESFYLAMPFLSWQTVIVGDPLCAPFRKNVLRPDEIAKDLDPETELPALFAARRLEVLVRGGLKPEALKLLLKKDAENGRENHSDDETLLMKATEIEPRLTVAQFALATLYESRNEFDKAVDRYRRILAVDPQNGLALNNLAYSLAERLHQPKDALPIAEKAFRVLPQPIVADTLAWVQHLLGDDRTAAPLLERAEAAMPTNVDILVHAGIVHAALHDLVRARKELDAALKADPKATDRDDVKALRDQLK